MLYLSQKPAYPMVDGGSKAIASFLENVSDCEGFNLLYAPICTQKHPLAMDVLEENIPNLKVQALEMNTDFNILDVIRNFFEKTPLNVKRYLNETTQQKLQKLDASNLFECVVCDGFYALCIVPKEWFSTKKVYYRAHNIEHEVWKQRATHSHGFKRLLHGNIARKMKGYETGFYGALEGILSISKDDTSYFKHFNPNTQTFFPTAKISNSEPPADDTTLCFIGNFDWQPNVDAIDSFLQEIYPHLRAQHPELQFHIAGKGSAQFSQKELGVYGHGFVEDSNAFLASHGIFIAPLRFGTGLNIKVMDALCLGKAAILSEVAIQGLLKTEGLCIAKTPEDFAHLLKDVIGNAVKQAELAEAAIAIAKLHFSRDGQRVALKTFFNV